MSRPRAPSSAELRRRVWLLGAIGVYLAILAVVVGLSWFSEHEKLARGADSRPFDALALGRLVAWPGSKLVPSPSGRPYAPDELDAAAAGLMCAGALQAGVVGWWLWRFGRAPDSGDDQRRT